MLEPRTVVNQCYILQERLWEDSFCELWRATSIYSATRFLLRFFKERPEIETRSKDFRSLAMDCYSIAAPAVLDFVEVERFEGRSFIASEYSGEMSLLTSLKAHPTTLLEHACRFIIELGQGLDAFNKRGIIYRSLNAENVLVTRTGDLIETIRIQKPGYFPLLPLLMENETRALMENYGYMSPEAKEGKVLDRRSDIYSLGIHFFRFIVGRLPYAGAKRARYGSVNLSYVARSFERRDVPKPVTRIVLKALRKDPNQRYGGALELIAELRAFMDERRRELLAQGEVDPLAELSTLNLGRERLDATQAVKSLETADYFRAMSEAYISPSADKPLRLFPVQDFVNPEEVEKFETLESEGEEDDGRPSSESFIEEAEGVVAKETFSQRRNAIPRSIEKTPIIKIPSEPMVEAVPEAAPPIPIETKLRPETKKTAESPGQPSFAEEGFKLDLAPYIPVDAVDAEAPASLEPAWTTDLTQVKGIDEGFEPEAAIDISPELALEAEDASTVGAFASDEAPLRKRKRKAEKAKVDAGGIAWRQDAASPQVVAEGMESAFFAFLQRYGSLSLHPRAAPWPRCGRLCENFRAIPSSGPRRRSGRPPHRRRRDRSLAGASFLPRHRPLL